MSVVLHTDEPDQRFAVGSVLRATTSSGSALTIEATRPHGDRLLVTFAEVADRTSAESLRGASLVVNLAPGARPDDPEEYYDHQLIGLRVRTRAARPVGTVVDVQHLPLQDVLEIALAGDDASVLVPFVTALVPDVDLSEGVLVVEELPGLLDDAEG